MPIAATEAPAPAPALAALRWRERAALVFAGAGHEAELRAQTRSLARAGEGLRDRELRVVVVGPAKVVGLADAPADLRRRYGVADDAFAVLLIGKDGHVADRSVRPVDPAELFALIDAMPMRRDEVRRRAR